MAAETEIERLLVRLVGDGTSYQRMLKDAQASSRRAATAVERAGRRMERIQMSLQKAGRAMASAGRRMTMFVTAPILGIGALATRSFAQFDQAMTESTSIMKVTEEQAKRMRDTVLSLSGKTIQSPKELAESYFFLASAGKDAEQSMALLPKVARFATAGAFDMALATDLLTDAQSALGLSSKNVAQDTANLVRVSDVLVKANTLANASVQQFSTALTSKAGAALKSYNKDVEEGIAVLAALADQGVKAELAGNALDRVIRLSSKGALDNAKAHAELGFRVFDASGRMRNLGDIIANLEKTLGGMSDKQRAAALDMLGFEARVQGVILPLLGTSDAIKRYEKELRKAAGTTEDVANKQLKSFTNQMKMVWNQLKVVNIEIGEVLAPTFLRLGEHIKKATAWWRRLSPEVKKTAVYVALAVAAIGPLLIGLGGLVSLAGFTLSGFGAMIGVLGALLSPTLLVTAAITGLGVAVLHWTGAGGQAVNWFGRQWDGLVQHIRPAIDGIKDALATGDIPLANKILWAQIEMEWVRGIGALKKQWAGFNAWMELGMQRLSFSMTKAYWKIYIATAKAKVRAQAEFDKTIDVEAMTKKLDQIYGRGLAALGRAQMEMAGEVADEVKQQVGAVEAKVAGLKQELGSLVLKANVDAQANRIGSMLDRIIEGAKGKLGAATLKLPEFDVPEIPKVIVPVEYKVITAAAAGSAEALSRIAEFQAAIAPPGVVPAKPSGAAPRPVAAAGKAIVAGAGMAGEGAADYLKELLELAKKHWQGPVIEIDPADLEG